MKKYKCTCLKGYHFSQKRKLSCILSHKSMTRQQAKEELFTYLAFCQAQSQSLDQEGIIKDSIKRIYDRIFCSKGMPYNKQSSKLTTIIGIQEDIKACLKQIKQTIKSKRLEGEPNKDYE